MSMGLSYCTLTETFMYSCFTFLVVVKCGGAWEIIFYRVLHIYSARVTELNRTDMIIIRDTIILATRQNNPYFVLSPLSNHQIVQVTTDQKIKNTLRGGEE